jgi:hypothetical protein
MKSNNKGQFSIIAALLVAIILVATVMSTYSAIRYSTTQNQPQVLTAVDETNMALKQLLGYTVGYYGSILQVTGNATYAQDDFQHGAKRYFYDGLDNIIEMHPEWGLSVDVQNISLDVDWYSNESYSSGQVNVKYDLTGLGLSGISYAPNCTLKVQVYPSDSGEPAFVRVLQDQDEPLTTLTKGNFKFYNYTNLDQAWNLTAPVVEPEVSLNGTYSIVMPSGMDSRLYLIQVKDARGLMVVGSSFNAYDSTFTVDPSSSGSEDFIDQMTDAYAPPAKGSHSNFNLQKASDGNSDTLTEENGGGTVSFINAESFEGTWPPSLPSAWAATGNWNKESDRAYAGTYSADFDGPGYGYASGDLTTPNLDCSGSITSITVDFWYRDEGVDSGEFVLQYYDGTGWDTITQLGTGAENQWLHYQQVITDSQYFKSSFKVRWSAVSVDSGEHAYVDSVTITKQTPVNYQLDLEEQFTGADYTQTQEYLCVRPGNLGSEPLEVDVRSGSSWTPVTYNLQAALVDSWFNVSVSSWLTSSTFTIRFVGTAESGDATPDTWQIDAVLLKLSSQSSLLPVQDSTTVIEWLQNGTVRWLGQNLNLTTDAKPIPPLPVKAIHLNQTFVNGTNREIPFQVEDWASDYNVPLGLTSNVTIFSNRQMIVFLLTSEVLKTIMWWNGSDTANQTPLAYVPGPFTYSQGSDIHTLTNGFLTLDVDTSGDDFIVTSRVGSTSGKAIFMRVNDEDSVYGANPAFVITNGVVRDIVQQEAEWGTAGSSGGADGCPNFYANIVLTLPARTSYYTYQMRLMFIDSTTHSRTITDLVPIQLYSSPSSLLVQTENGTLSGSPLVVNGSGIFKDYDSGSAWTAHHWSQIINSGTLAGAGIIFTDASNQLLYAFDAVSPASAKGALNVSSTAKTIEVSPVTAPGQVSSFQNAYDITWYGAVATFDSSTSPIYKANGGSPTGLWLLVEREPTITVTPES